MLESLRIRAGAGLIAAMLVPTHAQLGVADTITFADVDGTHDLTVRINGRIAKRLLFKTFFFCDTFTEKSVQSPLELSRNLVPSQSCPTRLLVFSSGHRVTLEDPFQPPEVTTSESDQIPSALSPSFPMPVTVWVATCEDVLGQDCQTAASPGIKPCDEDENILCKEARQEIEIANMILARQRSGIELDYEIHDISCRPVDGVVCVELPSVCPPPPGRTYFYPSRLNIYYVSSGSDQQCGCSGDIVDCVLAGVSQTIYVNSFGASTRQAMHEVGHAFALGHAPSSKRKNIMRPGSNNKRCQVEPGQRFRMSLHEESLLNQPDAGGPRPPALPKCGQQSPEDCPSPTSWFGDDISCDESY